MKLLLLVVLCVANLLWHASSYAASKIVEIDTSQLESIQIAETNAIAEYMCFAIEIITGAPGQVVFILIITMTGIGLYFGKITTGGVLGLLIGISIFFGSASVFKMLSEYGGGGCDCKAMVVVSRYIDIDGNENYQCAYTKLNPDCSESTYSTCEAALAAGKNVDCSCPY